MCRAEGKTLLDQTTELVEWRAFSCNLGPNLDRETGGVLLGRCIEECFLGREMLCDCCGGEQREYFFAEADRPVASMWLWHLIEEIEHKNLALTCINICMAGS